MTLDLEDFLSQSFKPIYFFRTPAIFLAPLTFCAIFERVFELLNIYMEHPVYCHSSPDHGDCTVHVPHLLHVPDGDPHPGPGHQPTLSLCVCLPPGTLGTAHRVSAPGHQDHY